jgi:hypothetical protein
MNEWNECFDYILILILSFVEIPTNMMGGMVDSRRLVGELDFMYIKCDE